MWTICKVFIEFVASVVYVPACAILAPWPGIKPTPPDLEGEVLTTGPPGKSRNNTPFKNEIIEECKERNKNIACHNTSKAAI